MSPEKALKIIANSQYTSGRRSGKTLNNEFIDIIIKSLNKQIPKNIINDNCPVCANDIRNWTGDEEFDYCPSCGQAIFKEG